MEEQVKDFDLISWYNIGWKDEMRMKPQNTDQETLLERRAYDIGRIEYRIGDDNPNIDLQTEQEIITHIRNK